MVRFIYFHAKLTGEGWNPEAALDAAIMQQKLISRLHGSKSKLRPVLDDLKKVIGESDFPTSLAKIKRMEDRLRQNGFTSSAEN